MQLNILQSYIKVFGKLKVIFERFYDKCSRHDYKSVVEIKLILWKIM